MASRLTALNLDVVPSSRVEAAGAEWVLDRRGRLVVAASSAFSRVLADLEGDTTGGADGPVLVGPASHRNAQALRRHLTWLQPVPLGTQTSAGLGDRLGLATPGHVRAVRAVGAGIAPIFAQQSIREMTRTGRTPERGHGRRDVGRVRRRAGATASAPTPTTSRRRPTSTCASPPASRCSRSTRASTSTSSADTADLAALRAKAGALPWADLEDTDAAARKRYLGRTVRRSST